MKGFNNWQEMIDYCTKHLIRLGYDREKVADAIHDALVYFIKRDIPPNRFHKAGYKNKVKLVLIDNHRKESNCFLKGDKFLPHLATIRETVDFSIPEAEEVEHLYASLKRLGVKDRDAKEVISFTFRTGTQTREQKHGMVRLRRYLDRAGITRRTMELALGVR